MRNLLKVNLDHLNDLFCIQKRAELEIGFCKPKNRPEFWQLLETAKENPQLKGFEFLEGGRRTEKLIIIQMHSTQIKEEDVIFWLKRYCEKVGEFEEIQDGFKIWTGPGEPG